MARNSRFARSAFCVYLGSAPALVRPRSADSHRQRFTRRAPDNYCSFLDVPDRSSRASGVARRRPPILDYTPLRMAKTAGREAACRTRVHSRSIVHRATHPTQTSFLPGLILHPGLVVCSFHVPDAHRDAFVCHRRHDFQHWPDFSRNSGPFAFFPSPRLNHVLCSQRRVFAGFFRYGAGNHCFRGWHRHRFDPIHMAKNTSE